MFCNILQCYVQEHGFALQRFFVSKHMQDNIKVSVIITTVVKKMSKIVNFILQIFIKCSLSLESYSVSAVLMRTHLFY